MNPAAPSPPDPGAEPSELLLAFAPLHKAALGAAIGLASAVLMFSVTAVVLLRHQEHTIPLGLLGAYFQGYSASWTGAVVGAAWGAAVGFVFGWFTAFCRNLALAVSWFLIRTRAELTQTRDFLDHI